MPFGLELILHLFKDDMHADKWDQIIQIYQSWLAE